MNSISKAEMLARMVESGDKPFRIKFVRGRKKRAGEIWSGSCYYGAPKPNERGASVLPSTASAKRNPRKTHLESNSIPLTEFGTQKLITPFISHIIEFNGRQVIH